MCAIVFDADAVVVLSVESLVLPLNRSVVEGGVVTRLVLRGFSVVTLRNPSSLSS